MTLQKRPAVLHIPKPMSETVIAYVRTGILGFFSVIAISNLLHGIAWIPSGLWLAIISVLIIDHFVNHGLKMSVANFLGSFSRRSFADVIQAEDGRFIVRFRFTVLGHPITHRAIPVEDIERVEWSTGQATSLSGRDMNDWQVVVRCDRGGAARGSWSRRRSRAPDLDIWFVGPPQERQHAAAFGQGVVSFLQQAGADLVRGQDCCSFTRRSVVTTPESNTRESSDRT